MGDLEESAYSIPPYGLQPADSGETQSVEGVFEESGSIAEHVTLDNEQADAGRFSRVRDWVRDRKLSLAVGASVVSMGVGMALNPAGETIDKIEDEAKWVVPTAVGLDVGIGVGVGMMLASAGTIIRNPIKAKKHIKDLPQMANNSKLFKAGFGVSTASAVAWGGVVSGSIIKYLPPEAWGTLAFPVTDLAVTIALRKTIWNSIKNSSDTSGSDSVEKTQPEDIA